MGGRRVATGAYLAQNLARQRQTVRQYCAGAAPAAAGARATRPATSTWAPASTSTGAPQRTCRADDDARTPRPALAAQAARPGAFGRHEEGRAAAHLARGSRRSIAAVARHARILRLDYHLNDTQPCRRATALPPCSARSAGLHRLTPANPPRLGFALKPISRRYRLYLHQITSLHLTLPFF